MSRFIGLLMVADEEDILARTLDHNAQFVDCFYVLDGSTDNTVSSYICQNHHKFKDYYTDEDLPRPPYPEKPRDGYRQFLLERAYDDYGYDNWFLLLHGDEMWTGLPEIPGCDGFIFRLPFYFPRAVEPWDYDKHPLDQLHWNLQPGWPEFRMFRGGPEVSYKPTQHFNVQPRGLENVRPVALQIKHYPYRSPEAQTYRASRHRTTGFDPDNYAHIDGAEGCFWTDEMIAEYQSRDHGNFRYLSAEA